MKEIDVAKVKAYRELIKLLKEAIKIGFIDKYEAEKIFLIETNFIYLL